MRGQETGWKKIFAEDISGKDYYPKYRNNA